MNIAEVADEYRALSCSEAIFRVARLVPPLWSLRDLVAVNPFLGYADVSIAAAHEKIGVRLGANLLPTLEYFADELQKGSFTISHLERVTQGNSTPTAFEILRTLENINIGRSQTPRIQNNTATSYMLRSFAAWLDLQSPTHSKWRSDVITDISRFCSTRYDQGIANWHGYRDGSLYAAWKRYAQRSFAMEARGAHGFRSFVSTLPSSPWEAAEPLVRDFEFADDAELESYLSCLIGEIPGWSGYLRQLAWHDGSDELGELPELLVIRLAYDVGLIRTTRLRKHSRSIQSFYDSLYSSRHDSSWDTGARLALLQATELAFDESLRMQLRSATAAPQTSSRPTAQVVLCIDVRSEILRRHIGILDWSINTYGFAGFFGLPLGLAGESGEIIPQCPALLQPCLKGVTSATSSRGLRGKIRRLPSFLKGIARSANLNFSYVENLGLASIGRFISDLLVWSKPLHRPVGTMTFPESSMSELAKYASGILTHLGLSQPFARVVLLCGHGANVTNNPQEAALGCGACGGHSGATNATAVAQILNDAEIREELSTMGWSIPEDTIFVAAIHDTVTDDVTVLGAVPVSHQHELARIEATLLEAADLVRRERASRLGITSDLKGLRRRLVKKAADIAEVRPEWALAGNAAFIIAPSEQLRRVNLRGRCFLHNYDHNLDPEGRVLETILTAPVVVASWINLQYFASTVDPNHFGSGLKTIHNICGGIGVVSGNDGDLEVGLSLQSVNDGSIFQHQPLRLQVYIQAAQHQIDRILAKHQELSNLVRNGWIIFHRLENNIGVVQ